MRTNILIPFFIALLLAGTSGQTYAQYIHYNFNRENGLASNHVYNIKADKYGYLWIATKKGVFKYDGYTFKVFDISTGMAEEDVWHLQEDKRGRMWALSISSEIGYIYNDRYKKIVTENPLLPLSPRFNPRNFIENKDGVLFLTRNNSFGKDYLCREKNDTLRSTLLDLPLANLLALDNNGTIVYEKNDSIFNLYIKDKIIHRKYICKKKINRSAFLYQTFLVPYPYYSEHGGPVVVADISNCTEKTIQLEAQEHISMVNPGKNNFYLTTSKRVLAFDTAMNLLYTLRNSELLPYRDKRNTLITILEDSMWQTCIATRDSGFYMNISVSSFTKIPAYNNALHGFTYIGHSLDATTYWWNEQEQVIASVYKNRHILKTAPGSTPMPKKIIPYNSQKSFLIHPNGVCWIYAAGNIENILQNIKSKNNAQNNTRYEDLLGKYANAISDAIWHDPENLYFSSFSSGFDNIKINDSTLTGHNIKSGRYPNIALDKKRNILIIYDKKNIYIYDVKKDKGYQVDARLPDIMRLKNIETIHIDTFGNIYLQAYDKLIMYNPEHNYFRRMLSRYQMNNATVNIWGEQLVVCAKYGVFFYNIKGPCNVGLPLVQENPKSYYYNYCINAFPTDSNIILNTDKGFYEVDFPKNNGEHIKIASYKFYAKYNDSIIDIMKTDTIVLDQKKLSVIFDIINPKGVGKIRYAAYLKNVDTAWQNINANEYSVPVLTPDNYYTLSIYAEDDVWKSSTHTVRLYIKPYWWQAKNVKRYLWFSAIAITIFLVYSIIHFTKKIVLRQQQKANLQTELKNLKLALELKSIYSQINPHFIFNTLSTGLYFIKKKQVDKAYEHISSFSDLLRSYIKSSRNRYITIEEEVENLNNYLQLQLARFDDKFVYQIIIDERINAATMQIPSLLLQPLVENAINHGLFHKEGKGEIIIKFDWDDKDNALICIIDDDGIGREQSKQINNSSTLNRESYGTELIKTLIDIFNTHETTKISLQYIDKVSPQTGTTVIITIRNLYHDQIHLHHY